MKKKVNDLVRLHEAMQEKLKTASYSEPIQILTLVPDKWSRMYCSEYFNIFEYLKLKVQVKYQQNLFLKKGKAIITETLHLVTNVFEDDNFSRQVLEKKDYVSVSKGVHKQKLQLAKVFVTYKNFILLSKKTPKCKYWVLKVLCLETQIVCSDRLKNDSLYLRLQRLSKCCVAS